MEFALFALKVVVLCVLMISVRNVLQVLSSWLSMEVSLVLPHVIQTISLMQYLTSVMLVDPTA